MPKDKEYTVPMEQGNDYTQETPMFGSPFQICLDRHEENKRKFTKSPGDGFHMASRPMFQSEFAEQSQVVVFIVLYIISGGARGGLGSYSPPSEATSPPRQRNFLVLVGGNWAK